MIPKILQSSTDKIAEICRKYEVVELALFGSQVRGEASENSDFDFLVEFRPEAKVSLFTLGRIKVDLETIVDTEVDVVPKDGLKSLIRNQVISESEIVYAA